MPPQPLGSSSTPRPTWSGRATTAIGTARTALWHLRHGGVSQVRLWHRRSRIAARSVEGTAKETATEVGGPRPSLFFSEALLPDRAPRVDGLRAAVILDDFSMLAWSYEIETVPVTPSGWKKELQDHPVDLLLVESAWHGNSDAWQYQLTGSRAPSAPLQDLVEHCRAHGVPTIFWNKEDPPHFEDFLDTARIFDHVFTTDVTLLPRYREELGHDRVSVLPFAAQSAVHNPVRPRTGHQSRDVAFAGMYFAHKFPERREQMDMLLGGALDASARMDRGLEIFSRFLGDDERYQFPGTLGDRVVGSLTYPQMLTAYKAYKVFLNVNSVVTSPSMCARRIFEITASGTPVVTAPSPAVGHFFPPEEVPVVADREQAAHTVRALARSSELRDRTVHLAQRRIWAEHTYSHRMRTVLESAGIDPGHSGELPTVSVLAATARPENLGHLLTQVGRQRGVQVQLVLVAHGFDPGAQVGRLAAEAGIEQIEIIRADASSTLGANLNRAVSGSDGEVLAKMDDDDHYGPWYLHDLLRARDFSGADVVGKHAHYMHLAGPDATLLRFPWMEHRYTDRIMGPTLTAGRDVFEAHPFEEVSRGEDTAFLRSVTDAGGTVYSSDRFNFVQQRGRVSTHSWVVDDWELLGSADVAWFGENTDHVMI